MIEPADVSRAAMGDSAVPEDDGAPHSHDMSQDEETYYVCPMPEHVDILYEEPGQCPICGMELVPVRRKAGHVETPRIDHWTCPMPEHSSVHSNGPGKCPICGMSLIPVPVDAAQDQSQGATGGAPRDDTAANRHEHQHAH